MTPVRQSSPCVTIACGGTGGHLFPGLAVAEELQRRGCAITLLVSPKEVDQLAVQSAFGMEVVTLPAVALQSGRRLAFVRGFFQSWWAARKYFRAHPPHAVLAMGGFTSVPPVLAARGFGAKAFLHESNTIPGRANRWLARWVDQAFVGFPQAAARLQSRETTVTGTPVRPEIRPRDARACRRALGLDPARPVVLVMGGSQGASGINDLILAALPELCSSSSKLAIRNFTDWQWLHLTGPHDQEKVRAAYARLGLAASVHPFLLEMDQALAAATVAVNRSGASSLAEFAALRLPSVLVPFPHAADDHQLHNARAFAHTGAAYLLEQNQATPAKVLALIGTLVTHPTARAKMQAALVAWHAPQAAERIADMIVTAIGGERADLGAHAASTFSLTPTLSPSEGERENRPRLVGETEEGGNLLSRDLLAPLPHGEEGQGEGERAALRAYTEGELPLTPPLCSSGGERENHRQSVGEPRDRT